MPTATAAVLAANNAPFVLEEVEVESPRAGEVLVRIVAAGLCHTDLSAREGLIPFPLPGVLGHEGAGVIEEVGDGVTDLEVGDHVVMSFAFCGACKVCRSGHPVYCQTWAPLNLFGGGRADGSATIHRSGGEDLHGHFFGQSSFATRAVAPAASVIKVPKEAPLELLGPLACGVQTGAQAVLNVLRPTPGSTLAVFGAGGVGLSAVIAAANLTGTTTISIDVNPARLELAKELGAAAVVNPNDTDPVEAVAEFSGGGVDYSLETSGIPAVLRQAVDVLAPLGTCGIVGAPAADADVALNVLTAIVKGSTVVGINQGDAIPRDSVTALADLYRQGRFPFDKLVKVYPFEEIQQAAEDAAAGKVVKPILKMPGE